LRRFEIPVPASAAILGPARGTVRVDAGVRDGSVIGVHYDPMLAKVIAHAPTREQAARLLASALAAARLHGVVTNRDLLTAILREDEFLAGQLDTGYLTRHSPADLMAAEADPRAEEIHATAVALADQALRRETAAALPSVPSGWRNVPNAPQQVSYAAGERTITVAYQIRGARAEGVVADVQAGGASRPARLYACTPDLVDLELDGVRRVVRVDRDGPVRYADSALGASTLTELTRFPEPRGEVAAGSLTAPLPGTVVRVCAKPGDAVEADQALVVLEAMKMEHQVRAPAAGRLVELRVSVGQTVDQGMVLAVVDSEADSGDQ
jgi:acetyl/propionyl-CoA carboxylase alpha subunit